MSDKAGRFRDFFDLQLRFAEAIAEKTATPIAEAVLRYTNFHRRFGLGDITADEPHSSWHGYAQELMRCGSHDARARWTQAFYAQSPDERLSFPDHLFGCFYFHASKDSEIVRLHFYNRDLLGPLSESRAEERRRELVEMFAYIRRRFPHVERVEGRSWLYGTAAYCRLFPEDYVRSRAPAEHDKGFQGMSRWGQFLDHNGKVKPALQETFLLNLACLDTGKLWQAFPLPSFRVGAPIQFFHAHYGFAG
ncbi:MAG: hypothetical protein U1E61_01885 [Bradyrhizobium sp.]